MEDFIFAGGMTVCAEAYPLLKGVGLGSFDDLMAFGQGERICHKRGRSVFRFEIGDRAFYLKRNRIHRVELGKALTRLRLPRLGAMVEWRNILALQRIGIPTVTPVAVGRRTWAGVETQSFTLTEEIYGAQPLDEVLIRDFFGELSPARLREKRALIGNLADLARRFHGHGMNHQDFYLNHFFIDGAGVLYLLDLQRVGLRRRIPERYRVKDLGQLHYSADFHALGTRTDRMRFFLGYLGMTTLGAEEKGLARRVMNKVRRIGRHDVKLLARRRRRGELPGG